MVNREIVLTGSHGNIVESHIPEYEVFYLLLKFIDTKEPVPSIAETFWIRQSNTCSEVSGLHNPWNFHTDDFFTKYNSLSACEADKDGDDANSPHEGAFPGNTSNGDNNPRTSKFYYSDVTSTVSQTLDLLDQYIQDGYGGEKLFVANGGGRLSISNIRESVAWEGSPWACNGSFYIGGITANFTKPSGSDKRYNVPLISATAATTGQWTSNKTTLSDITPYEPWLKESHLYNGWADYDFEFFYDEANIGSNQKTRGYVISALPEHHPLIEIPDGWREFTLGCPINIGTGNNDRDFGSGESTPEKDNNEGFVARYTSRFKAEIYLCSSLPSKEAIKIIDIGCSDLFSNCYDYLALVNGNDLAPQNAKDNIKELQAKHLIDLFLENYTFDGTYAFTGAVVQSSFDYNIKKYPDPGDTGRFIFNNYFDKLFNSLNQSLFLTVLDKDNIVFQLKTGIKNIHLENTEKPPTKTEVFSNSLWEFTVRKYFKISSWACLEISESEYDNLVVADWQYNLLKSKYLRFPDTNTYLVDEHIRASHKPNPEYSLTYFPVYSAEDNPFSNEYAYLVSCFMGEENRSACNRKDPRSNSTLISNTPYVIKSLDPALFNGVDFPDKESVKWVWNSSYLFASPRLSLDANKGTMIFMGSYVADIFYFNKDELYAKYTFNTDYLKEGGLDSGRMPTMARLYINKGSGNYIFYRSRPDLLAPEIYSSAYNEDDRPTDSFFAHVPFPSLVRGPISSFNITPYYTTIEYIDGDSGSSIDTTSFNHNLSLVFGFGQKNEIHATKGETLILKRNYWWPHYSPPPGDKTINYIERGVSPLLEASYGIRLSSNSQTWQIYPNNFTDINAVFWQSLVLGDSYYYVIEFSHTGFMPDVETSWAYIENYNSYIENSQRMNASIRNPVRLNSSFVKIQPPRGVPLTPEDINNTHVHCVKAVKLI